MAHILRTAGLVFGVVLALAACGSQVYNVKSEPLSLAGSGSQRDVQTAIRLAATRLGWTVKRLGPEKMEATFAANGWLAIVEISYNKKTFSITYKDSKKLGYDGTNIHRNYKGWILNLVKAIHAEISAI